MSGKSLALAQQSWVDKAFYIKSVKLFVSLSLFALLAASYLGRLTPLIIIFFLGLVISSPLLVRRERSLYWIWLVAFPFLYFEPFRIATLILGEKSNLLIPLLLMACVPGILLSFLTRIEDYQKTVPITIPLWLLAFAFFTNFFRFFSLFHPEYLIRDFGFVLLALFFSVSTWRFLNENGVNKRIVFNSLFGLGMANVIAIILEYALHFGMVDAGGYIRPMGIFGFPIEASFMASIELILGFYAYFNALDSTHRRLYGLASLLILLACLMTLTKTTILQLVVLIGAWGLFLPKAMRKNATFFVLALGLFFAFWEGFLDHGALVSQLTSRFDQSDTLNIRERAWTIVMSNLDLKTILFGQGWLSANELLGIHNYNYGLFPISLADPEGPFAIHTHNAYISYLYQLGILGLSVTFAYFGIMLKGLYRLLRENNHYLKLSNLAISTTCLMLLFGNLTGSPNEQYMQLYLAVTLLLFAYQAKWFQAADKKVTPNSS